MNFYLANYVLKHEHDPFLITNIAQIMKNNCHLFNINNNNKIDTRIEGGLIGADPFNTRHYQPL